VASFGCAASVANSKDRLQGGLELGWEGGGGGAGGVLVAGLIAPDAMRNAAGHPPDAIQTRAAAAAGLGVKSRAGWRTARRITSLRWSVVKRPAVGCRCRSKVKAAVRDYYCLLSTVRLRLHVTWHPGSRRGQPLFCFAGICAARAKYCPA
jgi:hypothetical protein